MCTKGLFEAIDLLLEGIDVLLEPFTKLDSAEEHATLSLAHFLGLAVLARPTGTTWPASVPKLPAWSDYVKSRVNKTHLTGHTCCLVLSMR